MQAEMIGQQFGRLKVVGFAGKKAWGRAGKLHPFYNCVCECGTSVVVAQNNLRTGNSKSCGCRKFNGYDGNATHGLTGTFEYRVWKQMRARCNNPNHTVYRYYGGRGIKVCRRWESFDQFLSDMGKAPSEQHSIERKNVNANYTPSNCEWIHKRKQSANRRTTIKLTFMGKTQTISEWAEQLSIPVSTIYGRYIKKWSTERILTQPRKNYAFTRS